MLEKDCDRHSVLSMPIKRRGPGGLLTIFLIGLFLVAGFRQLSAAKSDFMTFANLQRLAGGIVNLAREQGFDQTSLLVEGAPCLAIVNRSMVDTQRTRLLTWSFYTLTRVDLTEPRTFFSGQLPVAAMELKPAYNPGDPEQEGPVLELSKDPVTSSQPGSSVPSGPAEVGIYMTHNSESYSGDGGGIYETGNGEIAQVAASLGKALQDQGIAITSSNKIHDEPVRDQAYSKSIITASTMVKENPNLQALLDIHRDGMPDGKSKRVVRVDGQTAAPVMIVLAEKHSGWEQNDSFAKQLVAKGNQLYPGLFLPIYYASDARYNQHLLPHALLIEFGDQYNTTQEAARSAQAVAKALAEIIKQ